VNSTDTAPRKPPDAAAWQRSMQLLSPLELRYYQLAAIEAFVKHAAQHPGSSSASHITHSPGSGKTATGTGTLLRLCELYSEYTRAVVLVPSIELAEQWVKTMKHFSSDHVALDVHNLKGVGCKQLLQQNPWTHITSRQQQQRWQGQWQ
jgi:superfamily II DNA or RNA helicase